MGNVLFVIRCERDPDTGIRLEPVTRPAIEIERFRYSRAKLADYNRKKKLALINFHLYEFGQRSLCKGMVHRSATDEFKDFVRDISFYSYTPSPEAEGFGFDSPTFAWVHPQPQFPVVFWREADANGEQYALKWLETCTDKMRDLEWVKRTDRSIKLVVPDEFLEYREIRVKRSGRQRYRMVRDSSEFTVTRGLKY